MFNAGTHWEHLIPGFIVSGAGVGLINPPLASTAIGVVTPDRAGMASGINSTFRQVGIATGIAGLGTLFAHTVSTHIESTLRGTPGVSTKAAHALAHTVSQGSGAASGLGALPAKARPVAAHAIRAGFTAGLNDVFLVGALLALVAAVLTLLLIRSKDFESGAARGAHRPEPEPIGPGVTANQLLRGAEAVIAASGEASRDDERRAVDGSDKGRRSNGDRSGAEAPASRQSPPEA